METRKKTCKARHISSVLDAQAEGKHALLRPECYLGKRDVNFQLGCSESVETAVYHIPSCLPTREACTSLFCYIISSSLEHMLTFIISLNCTQNRREVVRISIQNRNIIIRGPL